MKKKIEKLSRYLKLTSDVCKAFDKIDTMFWALARLILILL